MNSILELKERKTPIWTSNYFIKVSPDTNNGVFRRYHVGNSPVNWIDPWGLFYGTPTPLMMGGDPYQAVYGTHMNNIQPPQSNLNECQKNKLACQILMNPTCSAIGIFSGIYTGNFWAGFGSRAACITYAYQLCETIEEECNKGCTNAK